MSDMLTIRSAYDTVVSLTHTVETGLATVQIVAEKIDDHFMRAELVQFSTFLRQIAIELRQALLQLDHDEVESEQTIPYVRSWDTALSDHDRHSMLLECQSHVKALRDSFSNALSSDVPQAIEDIVELHHGEVKQMQRHLRVMQEMVSSN